MHLKRQLWLSLCRRMRVRLCWLSAPGWRWLGCGVAHATHRRRHAVNPQDARPNPPPWANRAPPGHRAAGRPRRGPLQRPVDGVGRSVGAGVIIYG